MKHFFEKKISAILFISLSNFRLIAFFFLDI